MNNTNNTTAEVNVQEHKNSDFPELISRQLNKMEVLDIKISTMTKNAESAAKAAQDANKEISLWGGRKEAIEQLQNSGKQLALAVQSNAEAQQHSFTLQKELAEISKFLFLLGSTNIAQNRIVIRELELKMQGASQEKLSKLAKEELLSVIRQLKAQEDILTKVDQIKKNQRELKELLTVGLDDIQQINKDFLVIVAKDRQHEAIIAELKVTVTEVDIVLRAHKEINKQHGEALSTLTNKQINNDLEFRALNDKYNQQVLELTYLREYYQLQEEKSLKLSTFYEQNNIDLETIKSKNNQDYENLNSKNNFLIKAGVITIITFTMLN